MDAFNFSTSSLDKSSIASLLRRHQQHSAEDLLGGAGQSFRSTVSTATAATAAAPNKALELLSHRMRPVWMDGATAAAAAASADTVSGEAHPKSSEGKHMHTGTCIQYLYACIQYIS